MPRRSPNGGEEHEKVDWRTEIMCQVTEVVTNAQKNIAGERTLKMSSDQGEARSGPVCQVPGFPGCQDDCPLGSWLTVPWVP